jgi:hypothetical protein
LSLRDKPPYRMDELLSLLRVSRRFISDRMAPDGPVRWWKVGQVVFLDYDDVEETFGNPHANPILNVDCEVADIMKRLGG